MPGSIFVSFPDDLFAALPRLPRLFHLDPQASLFHSVDDLLRRHGDLFQPPNFDILHAISPVPDEDARYCRSSHSGSILVRFEDEQLCPCSDPKDPDFVYVDNAYDLREEFRGIPPQFLLYAPPFSGKTTFVERLICDGIDSAFDDTDNGYYGNVTSTNRHSMIPVATHSVAILPCECAFRRRCQARGLAYVREWYDDAVSNCMYADVVVTTNKRVSDAVLAMDQTGHW